MCDLCYDFIEDDSGIKFMYCDQCESAFCEKCIHTKFSDNILGMIESVKISIKRNLEGIPFGPSDPTKETRNEILKKMT